MTHRPDIWHYLKDHIMLPPEEVSHRLRAALKKARFVDETIPGIFLKQLEGHKVNPPDSLAAAIGQRCGLNINNKGERRAAAPYLLRRWYLPVAACVVLVLAGWLIYRSSTVAVPRKVSPINTPPVVSSAGRPPTPADTAATHVEAADVTAKASPDTSVSDRSGHRLSFSIEGQAIRMADNDLLASFASFAYPDVPEYLLRGEDKPLKIHIDQYTNIFVSPAMRSVLKELYDVKKNGKPSRKARRAKRRLGGWKERDERRFDKKGTVNPLDPVDLAEFILK